MKHNQSQFENGPVLTEEQDLLRNFLKEKNKLGFVDSGGLRDFNQVKSDIQNFAQQELERERGEASLDDETIKKLKTCLNEQNLEAVLHYEGLNENPEDQRIKEFYDSPEFEALYQEAQALLKPRQRVKGPDFFKLLKERKPEIAKLIEDPKYKDLSKMLWEKSDTRRRAKELFETQENKDIAEFFKDLSDIPPEDQHDAKKLILAFQKKFPNYQNKENEPWYLAKFEEEVALLKNPELKTLQDFYESDDFKKVCNQLSQTLGQAPVWKDIERALKGAGFEDIIALARKYEAASIAMTEKIWAREEKKFNELEKAEFDAFADKLTAKDFADLEATAERFQKTRKRYAGAKRLKWYREQLESKLPILEMQWQTQVDDFFSQPIRVLYVKASQQADGYPKWTDISALITDENLKYLLEEKYRSKAEGLWEAFWKEREQTFNEKGEQQLAAFFNHIKPSQLDDLAKAQADFEALHPEQKADTPWFKTAFEQAREKTKVDLESKHQDLVDSLSDRTLASAMQSAFKNAHTFAEREKWLSENGKKVAQYQSFIEQNNQLETEITTRASEHPDLKKELSQIKGAYQEGRKSYTEGFYSPRKYNENLKALTDKVNERERLMSHTMSFIESKNFNQIPKLTDKKKLSYDEFRDELKKLNFYELDPAVRKNEKVRAAARAKTTALHQQWLDHRALYLEKNKQTQIEKSQAVIKRVKLPKNMPDNLADYTAFTVALKEKGVYAALPKGVLKNEKVRATAHQQNMKMWQQYQTAKTKKSVATEKNTPLKTPEFKTAESEIKAVKLTPILQQKLSDKLKDKNATNPDIFTVALREIGIYQGVDKSLWQNPTLRETAWQQNLKLQQAFLEKQKVESPTTENENNETENNFGLPGHYKINWEKLEAPRTSPEKKQRAINRFKQMHNRSETGLQAVMQHFHQPLGTFVLQTLSVMPQDRFDKALNALKEVKVQAGNRADASQWLKVLCENAGLDFLEKDASVDWSQFKQSYSTHFGTSLDKAWAAETPKIEAIEEAPVDPSAVSVEAVIDPEDKAEDTQVTTTQTAADDEDLSTETAPEANEDLEADSTLIANTETETETVDEDISAVDESTLESVEVETEMADETQEDSDLIASEVAEAETEPDTKTSEISVDSPYLEAGDLSVDDSALDEVEDISAADLRPDDVVATEAMPEENVEAVIENEEDLAEAATEIDDEAVEVAPEPLTPDTLESGDLEVNDQAIDTSEASEENSENQSPAEVVKDLAMEDTSDEASLTKNGIPTETLEDEADESPEGLVPLTDVDEALEAEDDLHEDLLEAMEPPDTEETPAEDPLTENELPVENVEDAADESLEDLAPLTDVDEALEAEDDPHEDLLEAPEPETEAKITDTENKAVDMEAVETEIEEDVTPEIIVPAPIEAQEKEANVQEALVAWKNFTETNLPTTASQEAADLKKQFSEILKTGLDEATIDQLKASGTWEKLMASPAYQQLLRTHLKQHQALNRTELHFFTALQQELFFSRSVTVAKFLERLKSYVQFTKEINAAILTPSVQAEFNAETAQSLFNAFATKYHQTHQLETITLSYQNEQLLVVAKMKSKTQHWQFEAPAVRLS